MSASEGASAADRIAAAQARRAEVERIFLALARASADPLLDPEAARTTLSAEASVRVFHVFFFA